MKRKHTVDEVLKSLSRKDDCFIANGSRTIQVLKSSNKHNDLGNGSWGKIDFLVNHHNYYVTRVDKFDKK